MLIVIVIIGILAWALIPRIGSARDKANDTARQANVRSLATAMVSYWMDHNGYPLTGSDKVKVQNFNDKTWYILIDWLLSSYSIPSNNFEGTPSSNDHYFYNKTTDGDHFVIYTVLAWWTWWEWGNCDFNTVTNGTTYDTLNGTTTWNSFCYFQ